MIALEAARNGSSPGLAAEPGLTLVRLDPSAPAAWAQWPTLEARVVAASPALSPGTPVATVVQKLRTLWATCPVALGAWLAVDPRQVAVGHAVGWVQDHWGEPVLLVFQVQADAGVAAGALAPELLAAFRAWRAQVNVAYAAAGQPGRVDRLWWWTERPEAWARYLHAHGLEVTRSLTSLDVALGARPEPPSGA